MKIVPTACLLLLIQPWTFAAGPDVASVDLVKQAFEFPGGLDRHVDTNDEGLSKMGTVEWAVTFRSPQDLFMETTIACFKAGSLVLLGSNSLTKMSEIHEQALARLQPEIDKELEKLPREMPEASATELEEKRQELQQSFEEMLPGHILHRGDTPAYIQILGLGPGGGSTAYFTRLTNGGGDLLVGVFSVGEGEHYLHDSPETHAYFQNAHEMLLFNRMLAKAGAVIADALEASNP